MYKGLRILAVIPARSGSKGLPGKNVRILAGKPLIVHTIDVAKASGIFDYIMVSTDGSEIADISRRAGAEVPFLRPVELATDTARGIDVIHHAMDWCEQNALFFDWVMVLQPTSPLRIPEDILSACGLMLEKGAEAVVSVCETEHSPLWTNTLQEDLCMAGFIRPEVQNVNRQDLPKYYRVNGAIYLARWDYIKRNSDWYGLKTYAYIMPKARSIDIDSESDFVLAECLKMRPQLEGYNQA